MNLARSLGYGIGAITYSVTAAARRLGGTTSAPEVGAAPHIPADPWEGTVSPRGWLPDRIPARQYTGRLRVRHAGDWNDQLYAHMDQLDRDGTTPAFLLELRERTTGKLKCYHPLATMDSAHDLIKRNPKSVWRLIDRKGHLVGWNTQWK